MREVNAVHGAERWKICLRDASSASARSAPLGGLDASGADESLAETDKLVGHFVGTQHEIDAASFDGVPGMSEETCRFGLCASVSPPACLTAWTPDDPSESPPESTTAIAIARGIGQ